MRTTLTIEHDIMKKLKEIAAMENKSFKQVVNETLRKGFTERMRPNKEEPFTVRAKHCGFRPGIDIGKLNQISDNFETEEFVKDSNEGKQE